MKSMAIVAAVIACLAAALVAPPVEAATIGTARIGSAYGEAKLVVGTSTRLSIAAKNLGTRTAYTVSLRRGSCSTVGALVVSKRLTTSSYGRITTSFALTASQARLVKLPMSIRVGTRCGSFKAPVVPPPPLELRAAVDAGKVAVSGRGINLQRLEVTLTSRVAAELRLVIEPATVFRPGAAETQPMATLASQVVTLAAMESRTLTLDVACASMHLDQPGSSDQFALEAATSSSALVALLKVPDFSSQTFRVRQFAIWTITDNPPGGGYVHLGTFGFGSGPSGAELILIRNLFVKAGLDPAAYLALAALPPAPTPTPTPPPGAPTPTPLPSSTRANPIPLGQAGRAGDWAITVTAVYPDAWSMIQAANMFNDPPAQGKQFYMVAVSATYLGTTAARLDAGLGMRGIGASNVAYTTFGNSCGVLPDPNLYTHDPEVFTGGVVSGNAACWEISAADASSLVMYFQPFPSGATGWFALR